MKRPKINIGVSIEEQKQSKKLNFTQDSRAEALRRIEQNLRKQEKVPLKVENTKQRTFSDSMTSTSEIQKGHRRRIEQFDQKSPKNEASQKIHPIKNNESTPIFPGNFPTIYHSEEDIHRDTDTFTQSNWHDSSEEQVEVRQISMKEEDQLESKPIPIKTSTFVKQKDYVFDEKSNQNKYKQGFMFTLSVLGAVALGSLLGYLLLLVVLAGDNISTQEHDHLNTPVVDHETVKQPVTLDLIQGGTAAVGKLTIADRTFYAIQAGAFLEEQLGVQAYQNLKEQDVPVLLFEDDVYRLFLGIGYREEDVVDLRSMFRWLDSELYLKKYTVRGATISVAGATKSDMELLDTFFIHGTYLLEKTAAWTGDALNGNFTVSAEDWRKYKSTHETFLQEAKQLAAFLPNEHMTSITFMKESMDQAVLAMARYLETGEMVEAVQSQQGLLQYFEAYRTYLSKVGHS